MVRTDMNIGGIDDEASHPLPLRTLGSMAAHNYSKLPWIPIFVGMNAKRAETSQQRSHQPAKLRPIPLAGDTNITPYFFLGGCLRLNTSSDSVDAFLSSL